ncbi:MAG: hypothetical protein H0U70_05605 [Tatlockia sp.]|nr:hypothetical protein [Tatlockia sp.]
MNWNEFKQLIDLISAIYFAKDKPQHDVKWQEFESIVDKLCEFNQYKLGSETPGVDGQSDPNRAKKLYAKCIQYNYYFTHPCNEFLAAIGHVVNNLFGTSHGWEKNTYTTKKNRTQIEKPKTLEPELTENSVQQPVITLSNVKFCFFKVKSESSGAQNTNSPQSLLDQGL